MTILLAFRSSDDAIPRDFASIADMRRELDLDPADTVAVATEFGERQYRTLQFLEGASYDGRRFFAALNPYSIEIDGCRTLVIAETWELLEDALDDLRADV